jgi:hypothetical protein
MARKIDHTNPRHGAAIRSLRLAHCSLHFGGSPARPLLAL